MDDKQRLFDIIAVLTQKLGGKVTITDEQLQNPPEGIVTRDNASGSMVIEVKS